jgi:hypothetical protein
MDGRRPLLTKRELIMPENRYLTKPCHFRWLYRLFLNLDANFRLQNRVHALGNQDPPLAPGLAYMVDPVPYKEHLKPYVHRDEVSFCLHCLDRFLGPLTHQID